MELTRIAIDLPKAAIILHHLDPMFQYVRQNRQCVLDAFVNVGLPALAVLQPRKIADVADNADKTLTRQPIGSEAVLDDVKDLLDIRTQCGLGQSFQPFADFGNGQIDNLIVAFDRSQGSVDFMSKSCQQRHGIRIKFNRISHLYFSATAARLRTRWTSCLNMPCTISTWSARTS